MFANCGNPITIRKNYLNKISDEVLYAYNVYQIEGEGRKLFSSIEGDENTIMRLPIKKIKKWCPKIIFEKGYNPLKS